MHWTKSIAACAMALTLGLSATAARGQAAQPNSENLKDWWKNAVIYEIYPRSYQDTNGDGIGDLNGITQRLDYLKSLGVDAIWLTPIYPSPQVDFGYDIADYQAIDPQYGTMADFDRLMTEANKRHIRVIMDMVMNHSSDKHKWFMESRSSKKNPYRDWYVWHDGKGADRDRQRTGAEQLAIGVRRLGVGVGREDAPVLVPQVLCRAAGPELEQSQGPPGIQGHHCVLAEEGRGRIPLRRHHHLV